MPNQPAKNTTGIYTRVHQDIKAAIQSDVERLNAETPGANMSISSWIRGAIETRLEAAPKKQAKK